MFIDIMNILLGVIMLLRLLTHRLVITHIHELLDPLLHIRTATVPEVPLRPSEGSQKLLGLRRRNCDSSCYLHLTVH